jgi:hypothetical protein
VRTSDDLKRFGSEAVKRLREQKLRNGFPFMIHLRELPSSQCYLECLGAKITVVTYSKDYRSLIELAELSIDEANKIREKLGFNSIPI